MRIAFVTDKSAPYFVGGYENRVFEFARRLAVRHDVRVFTSLEREDTVSDGVRFERVAPVAFQRDSSGARSLTHSSLFAIELVRDRLAKFAPDAVIVEAIPYAHLVTMGRWIARLQSRVILDVVEAWGDYRYTRVPVLNEISQRVIHSCLTYGIGWADNILVISEATRRSLLENYAVDAGRLSLVPLGLARTEASKSDGGRSAPAEYDVVTVGRLVASKRPSDLLSALGIMKRRWGWRGKAAIIGSGPLDSALASQIERLGLRDQVRLTGFLAESEKRRILATSRVFALTSEREGFSLATLEGLGHGLPAIVARPAFAEVFGAADFVQEGRNGLFFPVGDSSALADRLQLVLGDPTLERRLADGALASVAPYLWDSLTARLEEILSHPNDPRHPVGHSSAE